MGKLWTRISLIVAVAFAITVLAIHEEPHHHMWRYLFWPGFAMAVDWLHIDFWRHPVAAFCLGMTFNTLIYAGLLGLFLWFLRPVLRKSD